MKILIRSRQEKALRRLFRPFWIMKPERMAELKRSMDLAKVRGTIKEISMAKILEKGFMVFADDITMNVMSDYGLEDLEDQDEIGTKEDYVFKTLPDFFEVGPPE